MASELDGGLNDGNPGFRIPAADDPRIRRFISRNQNHQKGPPFGLSAAPRCSPPVDQGTTCPWPHRVVPRPRTDEYSGFLYENRRRRPVVHWSLGQVPFLYSLILVNFGCCLDILPPTVLLVSVVSSTEGRNPVTVIFSHWSSSPTPVMTLSPLIRCSSRLLYTPMPFDISTPRAPPLLPRPSRLMTPRTAGSC